MAKVFPEIRLNGLGVELKLYADDGESDDEHTDFSILLDNGYGKVAIAHTKTYDEAVEVIQVFMQGCAALGYDLDSVN